MIQFCSHRLFALGNRAHIPARAKDLVVLFSVLTENWVRKIIFRTYEKIDDMPFWQEFEAKRPMKGALVMWHMEYTYSLDKNLSERSLWRRLFYGMTVGVHIQSRQEFEGKRPMKGDLEIWQKFNSIFTKWYIDMLLETC